MATHGTRACFKTGCRLPECVKASRDYERAWRRKHGVPKRNPPSAHGTRSRYNKGCRCEYCTAAAAEYTREWRRGR